MKPKSTKSLLALALLAPGALFAQTTAKTTPVGYETINLIAGFNYTGLRLHNPTLAAGVLDVVTGSAITDNDVNIAALVSPTKTYIVEVKTVAPGVADSGAVSEVLGSAIIAGAISTPNDLTAVGVEVGDKYVIRESATIASVFGAANSAGLKPGYTDSIGADLVYVPNSVGDFDVYYYDAEAPATWRKQDNTAVVAADIPLVYLDSMIVFANTPLDLVVSGEVNRNSVIQVVKPGFNYIGGVHPAGATLDSSFSPNIGTIHPGYTDSIGADVIYIPDAMGNFATYYYDAEAPVNWKTTAGAVVDATTIAITPGLVYFNAAADLNIKNQTPSFYSSL